MIDLAVINKTIFMAPREGNPPPRIWETPCGMLNSIGIPSEGLKEFVRHKLPPYHESPFLLR